MPGPARTGGGHDRAPATTPHRSTLLATVLRHVALVTAASACRCALAVPTAAVTAVMARVGVGGEMLSSET
ncbi:hypothetical protein ACFYUY_25685 [Kitasatospora sp. NPDC004745]|uniref:hypothetical protein n=1 Tax=Kitasatospora sp. NPDC004745 TaxID=3364019 RepID=UPI0036C0D2FE